MNCTSCQTVLPDLLPGSSVTTSAKEVSRLAAARAHLAACLACAQELASLEATFALLDSWEAPGISPYFDQKLAVRLREEQAAPPAGWFERMKDRLQLNTGRQFRPALAAALVLVLVVGGGSFGISTLPTHPQPAQASATVQDLQILDKNEQALQQMDQLLQDDAPAPTNPAAPPAS